MKFKEIEQASFNKWFGKSKVINKDGSPKVVYHGRIGDFECFDSAKVNDKIYCGGSIDTFYFTDNTDNASGYAGQRICMTGLSTSYADGGNVMPVYLKMEKTTNHKCTKKQLERYSI